jgi:hypothetical protein
MAWAVNPSNSKHGRLMTGICFEVNGTTVALKTSLEFLHLFLPHCQARVPATGTFRLWTGQRFRGVKKNALQFFVLQRVFFCKS